MKMMKKAASKRFAALVVLGAMLFALAAPQASAADQTADKTESYTTTATYYDGEVTEEETVTYQIGGKIITTKLVRTYYSGDGTSVDEVTITYKLSQPLKAIEKKDEQTVIWDVPAGTEVTKVLRIRSLNNGTVVEDDSYDEEGFYWYEVPRVFSRKEIYDFVPRMAYMNDEGVEFDGDKIFTAKKGKYCQLIDQDMDGDYPCPGNPVFYGV